MYYGLPYKNTKIFDGTVIFISPKVFHILLDQASVFSHMKLPESANGGILSTLMLGPENSMLLSPNQTDGLQVTIQFSTFGYMIVKGSAESIAPEEVDFDREMMPCLPVLASFQSDGAFLRLRSPQSHSKKIGQLAVNQSSQVVLKVT